jgi:acyl-CoA thioester hydrolase
MKDKAEAEAEAEANFTTRNVYTDWITDNIRYCDLDPNGHVNNGAINAFFEDGRVQFRMDRMEHYSEDILTGFVLVKFSVEYLKALNYPGSIDVGTLVSNIGRTSYLLKQGLFRDEECIAIAEVVTVCFNKETEKAELIDDDLRGILEKAQKIITL